MNLFNLIAFASLMSGTICWLIVYVLWIKKMYQDQTIAIPLFSLAFSFSWEFIYAVVYPSLFLPSAIANGLWLLLDVGVLYSYYKFCNNKFRVWIVLPLVFLTVLGVDFIYKHYVNEGVFFEIKPLIFLGFIAGFISGLSLIFMLLKKGNSKGQSLTIAGLVFFGNFFYVGEVAINPAHKSIQSLGLGILMFVSVLSSGYYYVLLRRMIKNESIV